MSKPKPTKASTVITGIVMGAADLVPGVSGGTIALIFGIYDRLLAAITAFNSRTLKLLAHGKVREFAAATSLSFLLLLGLGMISAIAVLSEPLGRLLEDAQGRIVLYGFFFGLVVASVFVIGRYITWDPKTYASFLVGTVVAFTIVRLTPATGSTSTSAVFLAGAIAICAMVLPGISGSFILVILGQYDYVLDAVRHRDFGTIAIFGAGAIIGLTSFARLLRRLLARFHAGTMALLAGFMAGSLWKIWPWRDCQTFGSGPEPECLTDILQRPSSNGITVLAVSMAVLGGLAVVLIDRAGGTVEGTA